MKRAYLMFVLMFGLVALALAAADFSGTWVLDTAKSEMGGGGGGGRGMGGGGGRGMMGEMEIKQAGSEITITRGQMETKYVADGAEHAIETGRGGLKYKASLQGDTLTVTGTRTTQRGDMPVNESYALSDGGKVLTVSTTMTGPNGEQTRKMVYNKK